MTAAPEIVDAVARAMAKYDHFDRDVWDELAEDEQESTKRYHQSGDNIDDRERYRAYARAAIAAHEAALAAAGYVIAPREPTAAMQEAGGNCGRFEWDGDTGTIWPAPIWRAMIAALGE